VQADNKPAYIPPCLQYKAEYKLACYLLENDGVCQFMGTA